MGSLGRAKTTLKHQDARETPRIMKTIPDKFKGYVMRVGEWNKKESNA
jgi:hypothetical protein